MSIAKVMSSKVAAPKKAEISVSQRWDLLPYLIILLALLTLLSLFHVWSRVKVVDLNLQITEGNRLVKQLQQEKNMLRLEVASLKNPARIEALAKGELGMDLPTDQQVIIVK
ncbi:MAG: Cell division protein FtsL [Syntrophus sp. PtaB.Bin138]|jgi:cell division protein FtsL|nr:MAG: Cell division protein FtsL [Syntrophus sp. PtaB.Bin138]